MSPSEGMRIADRLLNRLLDRIEAQAERKNRVTETMPDRSWNSDDREDLYAHLGAARTAGAIDVEWGKLDNRHNIERIALKSADALYAFLERTTPTTAAERGNFILRGALADLPPALVAVLDEVVAAWAVRRNVLRDLGPEDAESAIPLFKAAAALMGRNLEGLDIRTFSRRVTGNSKLVESNIGRIADILRRVETLPDYLDASEVLAHHGVVRFPQACLLAGPIAFNGVALPAAPYIGIAPEMVCGLSVTAEPEWLLTVENLSSFNRQVREAAGGGVVIYTGGFPSEAAVEAILKLASVTACPIYHWGDIDVGGIKIAYRIERALAAIERPLLLHMMTPAIAVGHGTPVQPVTVFRSEISADSCVIDLARFIGSADAHFLEQEELDPFAPDADTSRSNLS